MEAKPQKQHEWLYRLLGEWTITAEAVMQPGQPPVRHEGRETVRKFGELWVVADGQFQMPAAGGTGLTTIALGYDPAKSRYIGVWFASMMPGMFVYEGEVAPSGDILTLNTEGPDFTGKISKFQDVIEFKNDSYRTLTSRILGENGEWVTFMNADYRRIA